MCFGGDGGAQEAAAAARAEEEARQGRISAGTKRIGGVFGQFDDDYYKTVTDTALNYYNPEANRQYDDARRKLTFGLARGGKLASTSGADMLRQLSDAKARADVDIANRSAGYANEVRGNVERQRGEVTSQLYATADPEAAFSSATNAANLSRKAPAYEPLGDLFTAFIASGANAIGAERAGYRGAGTGLFNNSARGSSRVIP